LGSDPDTIPTQFRLARRDCAEQAIKGRIRERTLELMEYYSFLGNDVQFVFISTNEVPR